ncbi:hypothetical protein ACIBF1_21875 [Spirillospora sp. NPDC050679]
MAQFLKVPERKDVGAMWKSLEEWAQAAIVAGAGTLSVSIAWAVLAPEGIVSEAHSLAAPERRAAVAATARQLQTLTTADLTRPDERLRLAESVASGGLRDQMRTSRGWALVGVSERLSQARVSTIVATGSGRGWTDAAGSGSGQAAPWVGMMAVIRGRSTASDGTAVEQVARYSAMAIRTPEGWRLGQLHLAPGPWAAIAVLRTGEPSEQLRFIDRMEQLTEKALEAVANGRPASRDLLTDAAARQYTRLLDQAHVPRSQGPVSSDVVNTGIVRRDRRSARLLMFVNTRAPEIPRAGTPVLVSPGIKGKPPRITLPETRPVAGPDDGAFAFTVTMTHQHGKWRITALENA